jgi:hypothetical protein
MATVIDRESPTDRNRRTLRVLLAIVAVLVLAAFAVGIRW